MKVQKYTVLMIGAQFLCAGALLAVGKIPGDNKRIPVDVSTYLEWVQAQAGGEETCRIYEMDGNRFARLWQGEVVRWVFLTGDYATFTGYRGWTNCLVEMEKSGRIVAVEVVDSQDTPPYVRRVVRRGFCKQFLGMNAEKNGRSPDDLEFDGVSGATLTCRAIARSVSASQEKFRALLARMKTGADGSLELVGKGELKELSPGI